MIEFARETFDQAYPDAAQLLLDHYEEIAWRKDKIKLNVDAARYRSVEKSGALRVFTARLDGALVGYCAYIVTMHLHYSGTKCGKNDVVFMAKSYRGGTGARLLKYCEAALKAEGVQVIDLHIKLAHNWGPMAERMGYEHTEGNYQKWIGD